MHPKRAVKSSKLKVRGFVASWFEFESPVLRWQTEISCMVHTYSV